jgi:hypothetical protein
MIGPTTKRPTSTGNRCRNGDRTRTFAVGRCLFGLDTNEYLCAPFPRITAIPRGRENHANDTPIVRDKFRLRSRHDQWSRSSPPQTNAEAANLELVNNYLATWADPHFDPDKVMEYYSSDARMRLPDTIPVSIGPAAGVTSFGPYIAEGQRFEVCYLDAFVRSSFASWRAASTPNGPPESPIANGRSWASLPSRTPRFANGPISL